MQIKLFVLLIACGSSPRLQTHANSDCSRIRQPTVTYFNSTYSNLVILEDDIPALNYYSDRQMGIFRISRYSRREWKRFTMGPLTAQASMIMVHTFAVTSPCLVSLVVPDPWNTLRVFMTTVNLRDFVTKPFEKLNDDWVNVVVTNSSEGRVSFILCDRRESLTLEPFVANPNEGTTKIPHPDMVSLNVTDEWALTCDPIRDVVYTLTEKIEKFINLERKANQNSKFIVYWILGVIITAVLLYELTMRFIIRPNTGVAITVENKLSRAAFS